MAAKKFKNNQVSIDNLQESDQHASGATSFKQQCIIFLDAASDSDFGVLRDTYDEVDSEENKANLIRFPDCEGNTALHFGAKNGNFKICNFIIDEAKEFVKKGLGDHNDLITLLNFRNDKGFTPLLSVAFRGYHTIGKKDKAIENRYRIIRALLIAGADMNKTRKETNMTAMHWLAHNNDPDAIKELL